MLVLEKREKGVEYPIGNLKKYSLLEIAKAFSNNIIFQEDKPGNRKDGKIDITNITKLGWKPKCDVIEYIKKIKNNL